MLGVTQDWPPGSICYKEKGRTQNKRPPWLSNELLGVLKSKKDTRRGYGKVAKYPLRTTRTLLVHAELQSGRLRVS